MDRHWHLEHRDGREWTQRELDMLVRTICPSGRGRSFVEVCERVCIDQYGEPFLLDASGDWHRTIIPDVEEDMIVVWDK